MQVGLIEELLQIILNTTFALIIEVKCSTAFFVIENKYSEDSNGCHLLPLPLLSGR